MRISDWSSDVCSSDLLQLGEAVQPPQAGRDLMLAVDLSGSMGEEDMTLGNAVDDRLTAPKAVIADFLDRRAGDRARLPDFGPKAYTLTPLTMDRERGPQPPPDSVHRLAGPPTTLRRAP